MKPNLKRLAILAFILLFSISCSDDDSEVNINGDINPERFDEIEIGNTDFKVPQFNNDLHTVFDYKGKTNVVEVYYDINPVKVDEPGNGEVEWQVSKHLVPKIRYEGQSNPHVHYHLLFDPNNSDFPEARPVAGVYSLKITIIEEDNSESAITKEFEIVKKFLELEIGDNHNVAKGSATLPTKFRYETENKTVEEIKYELWFTEWREGQKVPVGEYDTKTLILSKDLYENKSTPQIEYDFPINPEFPVGKYWLNIYVTESGWGKPVKLLLRFFVKE